MAAASLQDLGWLGAAGDVNGVPAQGVNCRGEEAAGRVPIDDGDTWCHVIVPVHVEIGCMVRSSASEAACLAEALK